MNQNIAGININQIFFTVNIHKYEFKGKKKRFGIGKVNGDTPP